MRARRGLKGEAVFLGIILVAMLVMLMAPFLAHASAKPRREAEGVPVYLVPAIYYADVPKPEQASSTDPVLPALNVAEAVKQNAKATAESTRDDVIDIALAIWFVFIVLAALLWYVARPYRDPRK